jgi:hypothetical protein
MMTPEFALMTALRPGSVPMSVRIADCTSVQKSLSDDVVIRLLSTD